MKQKLKIKLKVINARDAEDLENKCNRPECPIKNK